MSKQFCRKDSTIHGVGRLAKVLCDGLSLKGIGEALCIGAAGLFWWPYTGDHVGTHPLHGREFASIPLATGRRGLLSQALGIAALAYKTRGVVDPPEPRGEQQALPTPMVDIPIRGRHDDNDPPPRLEQEHLCIVGGNACEGPGGLAAVRWRGTMVVEQWVCLKPYE
jgi:hypothetical protein